MRQMPSTVKVGAHEYRIVRPEAPKNGRVALNGQCSTDDLTIIVKRGLRRSRAQQVLLHELCHATTAATDVPIEHEEKLVDLISEGLLQVIQDNPELVSYLIER